jgi:ATP-dependent helicase Lhr and Lhr-like helicase
MPKMRKVALPVLCSANGLPSAQRVAVRMPNHTTIRYGLRKMLDGAQIIPDNFLLRIRGDDLTLLRFQDAVASLRSLPVWDDEGLWNGIFDSLPGYRLSKFQPLAPAWVEREVVAQYLLDVPGAKGWLDG